MKKRLLSALLALCMVVGMLPASARAEETPAPAYELRTLTFEDADYKGGNNMAGKKDWSSLIDNPQYNGSLLYPTNGVVYNWYDEGNTYLKHQFTDEWGDHKYWGGGEAISNYNSGDIVTYGDFNSQLTVYKAGVEGLATTGGGHNGSNNFAVHYGYVDSSPYGGTKLQALTFGDGVARVIDHMYVTNICYALNCYTNGNDLTASIGEDDWVKLVATGHHTDGTTTTAEIYLCNGPEKIVKDWTKWDLSGLGEITKLELNVMGSSDNGYGFSQPAYFAYDDVAVRFPVAEAHECTFDQKVVSEDFLAAAANCTEPASYFLSCTCGKKGTETFTDGEAAGHKDENSDRVCDVCEENLNQVPVLVEGVTDVSTKIQTGQAYQLKDLELGKIFTDPDGDKLSYASYFYKKSSDGGETWSELTGFTASLFGGNDMTFVNDQEGTYIYKFWAYDGYGYSEQTWTLTLIVMDVVPADINFYVGQDQNYKNNGNVFPVLELYRTAGIDDDFNDYVGWFVNGAGETVRVYNPHDYVITDGETDYVTIDGAQYELHDYEKMTFTNSAFNDADETATASGTVVGSYNMFYATLLTGRYSTRFYGYNTTTSAYDIYLGGQSMALPMEVDIYGGGGNNLCFRIVSVYTSSKKTDGSYFTADDYVAQITMPITGSNIQSGDPYVSGNYTYYPFMSWANGNGSLYNVYVYPTDENSYIFSQAINLTTGAGASVVTKNMTITTAVELKITVPEDGEFGLYFQYNNFNTRLVQPRGEAVSNGDGTKTLTYTVSKSNSNYTWRLTDPTGAHVTSSGWVKGISAATEMTYTYSEATNKTNHDFSQLGTTVATRDEADIQLFASHSGFLSTASTTRIRAYRMWQLINSDTANIMVEPDYNVQVLQGNAGDIVQVDGGNGSGNWLDVTPSTTDIVAVNYDSMDVYADNGTHGSHGGLYPATNPERTAVMVVTNEAAGTADATIRFNGSLDTNRGSEWDYNYDTWFYLDTDEAPMLDFTVSATGDVTVSWASVITDSSLNSTLSGWTTLTPDESGAYHADLLCFRDAGTLGGTVIIKMTDSTGTSYRLARVAQMRVTIANATFPGEPLTPGVSVKLTFDGLYRSVNKIAGIFNPTVYYLRYTANGAEVNGQLGQYQQMDRASITIPLPKEVEMDENGKATYTFTNGYIYGQMYSAVSPFNTMYGMTDTGVGTNFSAASINFVLSRLADVTVEMETMSTFDVTVDVTDGENAITDYAFILKNSSGEIVTPDETGIYRQLEWGTYSYVLKASGYIYEAGTVTVGSDYADKQAEDGTVHWAFQLVKGSEGCWDGTTSEPELVDGVYQIGTGAELAWFAGYVNAGNTTASAVLTADIDLAAYEWTPIGNSSVKFAGSFDGQNHTISNLAIRYASTAATAPYAGLFGYVQGTSSAHAAVCNLTVNGEITMTSTGNVNSAYSGGIIGYAKYADLTNLHNETNVTVKRVKGNWDQIGGIVSYADNCTISDCSNSGAITGYRYVGGIVATLASGTVSRCYNTGAVTSGYSYIGGVVAKSNAGTVVSECYNAGAVNGGSTYAGGIVGYVTGTLTSSYNVGSITASGTKTGGVAGYGWSSDNSACVSNCFTTGSVTDTSNEVGAALGYMQKVTITNVYCLEGIHEKTMGGSKYSTGEPVAVSAETIASAEFVTTMNADLETPAFIAGEIHPILSWEQETVVLTTLSALGIYSTYSSADADIFPMTPAFDPAVKEYTVVIPDNYSSSYAKATLAEGVTGTITAAWTNLNNDEAKTVTITSGKTSGQTLAGVVKTGNYKNTVTFTVTGEDFEDVYTLNIVRTPTLTGLALEGMKLSPTFSFGTTAYTATTAQDSVTVAATPRDESYTVTVNGTDSNEVALEMGENVIHVVVKNAEGYETTYTITVTRKAAITVTFETNVENPNIVMKDANKIQVVPVDGVYTLITGETYSYTIQKDGYVGQMNSFTLTESGVIEITLVQATENPDLNKNIYAQWGNFRKGDNNLGITDARTPYAPEDAELLWAVKYGTGWAAAPGSPIMVDGDIITYIGTSIKRLDRMTGAVKAEGTMVGKSSFSIVPATYADGMIFVGLSGGKIQAFNAVTLESLWVYTDDLGGQPNCPITYKDGYVYAGFWNSETKDAHFVCVSTIDEDHGNTTEAKLASWTYTRAGGFYWAGAYVTDKLAIVGTDDGQGGSTSDSSSLLVFDRFTGELLDHHDGIHGDIRSNVSHDPDSDRIFFTSKGGVLCNAKVDWTTGKITDFHQVVLQDANGTEYAMSTCTPSVYNGRIYIGVCGASQFGDNSGHAIAVYDLNSDGSMTRAYAYAIIGYPQTSAMVTTAYADEDDGSVYIYLPYNAQPGGVSVLKDKKGQTAPITTTDSGYSEIFTPVSPLNQYCICSTIADEYGTIYYKNDSCYMMAITSKIESLELVNEPTFTVKDDGTYEVSGLKVVTHQKNGTTRDVTNYVTVDYNAETGAYSVSYTYGLDSENYGLKTLTVYSVTQPDCEGITFTGDTTAAAGEDYTFTVTVKPGFQTGEGFAVKANGETLTANEDGTYTIPAVAESIVITVEGVEAINVNITVYYADNGTIVTGKDGTVLNFADVKVTDVNGDGKLTMYDGFYCFHEKYHVNGAAGYTDNNWITKFWSVNTAMVSYGHNNRWVYSTAEEIAEGDSLCLFTYQDQMSWSDLYTYFDSLTATTTANEEISFHVNGYSFFGSSSTADALAAPVGATVTATCGETVVTTTVDASGNFKLTFPSAGEWTVLVSGKCSYTCDAGYYAGQTYTNAPVAPAMMTVTVEAATYTVTLSEDKSFTISPCTGYTTSVKEGESFKFYVETSVGYQPGENFAVKANGETLTADSLGNYTVENVTANVTITVEGMEAIIWEPVNVYFSISHDGKFQTGKESGEVMALRKISVPYFDLALYGLEDFYFNSETYGSDGGEHSSALEPGTAQYAYGKTTLLHLYIYALEVYYCGLDESEAGKGYLYNENLIGTDVLTITGSVGSLYMNQFWGGDENLNYYVNYEYPLASEGWGSTSDQILLRENDVITLGHFTSWSFYSDPEMGFNYLTPDEANKVYGSTTVTQGDKLTLNAYRAGADMTGNYTTGHYKLTSEPTVYYAEYDSVTSDVTKWTKLGTVSADGTIVFDTTSLKPGTYVVALAGQYGKDYTDDIVSTPGGILVVVEEKETTPGDVNGDGKISVVDVAMVQMYLKGKTTLTEEQLASADVNGDGKVTSMDVTLMNMYIRNKLDSFPTAK